MKYMNMAGHHGPLCWNPSLEVSECYPWTYTQWTAGPGFNLSENKCISFWHLSSLRVCHPWSLRLLPPDEYWASVHPKTSALKMTLPSHQHLCYSKAHGLVLLRHRFHKTFLCLFLWYLGFYYVSSLAVTLAHDLGMISAKQLYTQCL